MQNRVQDPRVAVERVGTVCVLRASGNLTVGRGAELLRQKFAERLEAGESRFVINLLDVPYMDSSAIGELIACQRGVGEESGRVRLVVPKKIDEVLRYLCVLIDMFDDEQTALDSFGSESAVNSSAT